MSNNVRIKSGTLGFPRMGPRREMKSALVKHWRNDGADLDEAGMLAVARDVEQQAWDVQLKAGCGLISAGDHCLYDNLLAWTEFLGAIPKRHSHLPPGNQRVFAMARGVDGAPALDTTKFSTRTTTTNARDRFSGGASARLRRMETITRGINKMGADRTAPMVLGPVTWVYLARHADAQASEEATVALKNQCIDAVLPVCAALMGKLPATGVKEVQLHEAGLGHVGLLRDSRRNAQEGLLQRQGVSDAVHDGGCQLRHFLRRRRSGGVPDKILGAGIADGRSPWAFEPTKVVSLVREIAPAVMLDDPNGADGSGAVDVWPIKDQSNIRVQASCSLQFVPWDVSCEEDLSKKVGGKVLAFAVQKVEEVVALTDAVPDITSEKQAKDVFPVRDEAWKAFKVTVTGNTTIAERLAGLTEGSFSRPAPFHERVVAQSESTKLPLLPTTTIGYFPQTAAVRRLRR
eukprot:g13512.t1